LRVFRNKVHTTIFLVNFEAEDVVREVPRAVVVLHQVEDLEEREVVLAVHQQLAVHADQQSAHRRRLEVVVLEVVLDGLEAEALELVHDVLEPAAVVALVGEAGGLAVEVDHLRAVVHHGGVVAVQEVAGQILRVHFIIWLLLIDGQIHDAYLGKPSSIS